jgi:hypothetical protein
MFTWRTLSCHFPFVDAQSLVPSLARNEGRNKENKELPLFLASDVHRTKGK